MLFFYKLHEMSRFPKKTIFHRTTSSKVEASGGHFYSSNYMKYLDLLRKPTYYQPLAWNKSKDKNVFFLLKIVSNV